MCGWCMRKPCVHNTHDRHLDSIRLWSNDDLGKYIRVSCTQLSDDFIYLFITNLFELFMLIILIFNTNIIQTKQR